MREDPSSHSNLRTIATALAVWLSIFLTVRAFASPVIDARELEGEISQRVMRVEEFQTIRQAAERMGVKVYLFGGTAAGFAHYVKWDLQREKGDSSFKTENFDYDYTNIYRSTQDLDIVLDGSDEQARELEQFLMNKYSYMKGGKSRWEIRLLREKRGEKIALLDSPDFLNQHTDSNSTGLIDITRSAPGDSVHDLRDWNSETPYFLRDVAEGKIHYYDSPKHESTSHFVAGENPPINSVIRFLTKAFQFELEMRPEDLAVIKRRIVEFDAKKDLKNPRASAWLEKNAAKLLQSAVNIEYAVKTLDELGLRSKLIALGDPTLKDTMAWWLAREPLKTKVIGAPGPNGRLGKTARELSIDIVAHETVSFLAYESITRSHRGDANALISRNNVTGEAAAHGDGFYTRMGRDGARGTKITIRFKMNPNAREGSDFEVHGDYVVVKNKAALEVIPESLHIELLDFLEMVAGPEFKELQGELALMEKLRRRLAKWTAKDFTHADKVRLRPLLAANGPLAAFLKTAQVAELIMVIAPFRGSDYEDWFRKRLEARSLSGSDRIKLSGALGWEFSRSELISIFQSGRIDWARDARTFEDAAFAIWERRGDIGVMDAWVHALTMNLDKTIHSMERFTEFWLRAMRDPKLEREKWRFLRTLIELREREFTPTMADDAIARFLKTYLPKEESKPKIDQLLRMRKLSDIFVENTLASRAGELGRDEIVRIVNKIFKGEVKVQSRSETLLEVVMKVAPTISPSTGEEWLTKFAGDERFAHASLLHLARSGPDAYPSLVEKYLNEPGYDLAGFAQLCLRSPNWIRPEFIDHVLELDRTRPRSTNLGPRMNLVAWTLSEESWMLHPEVYAKVSAANLDYGAAPLGYVSDKWLEAHAETVTKVLKRAPAMPQGKLSRWTFEGILKTRPAQDHPEWVEIQIRRGMLMEKKNRNDTLRNHFANHEVLKEVLRLSGGLNRFSRIDVDSLTTAFISKGITVEQAKRSLEERSRQSPSLLQKWLKPRKVAPVRCEQVFMN